MQSKYIFINHSIIINSLCAPFQGPLLSAEVTINRNRGYEIAETVATTEELKEIKSWDEGSAAPCVLDWWLQQNNIEWMTYKQENVFFIVLGIWEVQDEGTSISGVWP